MNDTINFDKETTLVLIHNGKDWEDKTYNISIMYRGYHYGNFSGYNIYFYGNKKKYFYSRIKILFYKHLESIDINKKDVYVDGEIVNASRVELFEHKYYRIYADGNIFASKNVKFKSSRYNDIYEYFIRLSYYADQITKDDEPLHYLAKNYRNLNRTRNSALYDFFNGQVTMSRDRSIILVPFDFNNSQYNAIEEALNHNISIIEGPPGTGKTQTILNLIANILYRGKNCAVVSNNNTAIDNVYDKLHEEGLAFVAARLGSNNNVSSFFDFLYENDLDYFLERDDIEVLSNYHMKIKEYSQEIKKIQDTEIASALLKTELNEIEIEKKSHNRQIKEEIKIREFIKPKYYLRLLKRLKTPRKLIFLERWLVRLVFNIRVNNESLDAAITGIENAFYQKRISEIQKLLELNAEIIKEKDGVYTQLKNYSSNIFLNRLKNHYLKNNVNNFSKSSYKNDYNNFLLRYPVILSTTFSVINNSPKGFVYDYLIIDEASQCDMFSSVLAMSCAKNIVIVGDSRQLQQIDEERLFEESKKLAQELEISDTYKYEANCILKSIKDSIKDVPTTLLREHYRSSPDIIGFCNRMFYNNELVIMTKNNGNHLEILKTVGGNHARKNPNGSGLYNKREIDELSEIIKRSESNDIGIITPFRYQANLIQAEYLDPRIEADTVHKFQGRQKDEVILSFVVNSLDKDPDIIENKLYDFITNEKLLNVAISRGKNKVTAIVSDGVYNSKNNVISDFIKYTEYICGSVTVESSITSIFDYLYTSYTSELKESFKKKPDKYLSELLMCDLIDQVILNHRFITYSMHVRLGKIVNVPNDYTDEEKKYLNHSWTHVDFLFYNKVSKERLFVIEVDGVKFHEQDEKQLLHDALKDRVLRDNNVPIYRFKTNESKELERLTEIIKDYTH